jgi:hypothetical protein
MTLAQADKIVDSFLFERLREFLYAGELLVMGNGGSDDDLEELRIACDRMLHEGYDAIAKFYAGHPLH